MKRKGIQIFKKSISSFSDFHCRSQVHPSHKRQRESVDENGKNTARVDGSACDVCVCDVDDCIRVLRRITSQDKFKKF